MKLGEKKKKKKKTRVVAGYKLVEQIWNP
jgi:hypothetical protein